MSTAHTGILMKMGGGKVFFMTVVDDKTIKMNHEIEMVAVNTTVSPYSNMLPAMTIRTDEVIDKTDELRGEGIAGIARSEVWAIKHYNGIFDF